MNYINILYKIVLIKICINIDVFRLIFILNGNKYIF